MSEKSRQRDKQENQTQRELSIETHFLSVIIDIGNMSTIIMHLNSIHPADLSFNDTVNAFTMASIQSGEGVRVNKCQERRIEVSHAREKEE